MYTSEISLQWSLCRTHAALRLQDGRGGLLLLEKMVMWGESLVWGLLVEVGRKRFSKELKRECHGICNGPEVCIHKISFPFFWNPPLHNWQPLLHQEFTALSNTVLMAALPDNSHWRVLCGQLQARGSLFYSLHTTGRTHYNLIEHKGTLTIITIKSKQSTLQINASFKTCFLTSVSSQTYGYCPLERPQSDGQESATTPPSAVPAIMFNYVCSTRSQAHMQYI